MANIKSKIVEERDKAIYAEFERLNKSKYKNGEMLLFDIAKRYDVSTQTIRRAISKFE